MVYVPSLRTLVKERDKSCKLCESDQQLQIHHIVWKHHGGSDCLDNLILLCGPCHLVQHGKHGQNGILKSKLALTTN
jgi:RNA-directed DNA polymerase